MRNFTIKIKFVIVLTLRYLNKIIFIYFLSLDKYQKISLNLPLSALALFTVHSNRVNNIDTTESYPSEESFNPIVYSYDSNYHTSNWRQIYGKNTIEAAKGNGNFPLNTNPLFIIPYKIAKKNDPSITHIVASPLKSVYEIQHIDASLKKIMNERVIHPDYVAVPIDDYTSLQYWDEPSPDQTSNAILKEFFKPLMKKTNFMDKKGLLSLFKPFKLSEPGDAEKMTYHDTYECLRDSIQEKFWLRFSFMEGNHRLVVSNKLLSQTPFGSNVNFDSPLAKVHSFSQSKAGYHEYFHTTIYVFENFLPDVKECKSESNYIRESQSLGFEQTASDVVLRTIEELIEVHNTGENLLSLLYKSKYAEPRINVAMNYFASKEKPDSPFDPFLEKVMMPIILIIAKNFFSEGFIKNLMNAKKYNPHQVILQTQGYGIFYSGLLAKSMFSAKRNTSGKGKAIPFDSRAVIEVTKHAGMEKQSLSLLRNLLASTHFNIAQLDRDSISLSFGTIDFFFLLYQCAKKSSELFLDFLETSLSMNPSRSFNKNTMKKSKMEFIFRLLILSDIMESLNDLGEDPEFDKDVFKFIQNKDEKDTEASTENVTLPHILLSNYHLHVKDCLINHRNELEDIVETWSTYFSENASYLKQGIFPQKDNVYFYKRDFFPLPLSLSFSEYTDLFFIPIADIQFNFQHLYIKHNDSLKSVDTKINENKTKTKSPKTKKSQQLNQEEELAPQNKSSTSVSKKKRSMVASTETSVAASTAASTAASNMPKIPKKNKAKKNSDDEYEDEGQESSESDGDDDNTMEHTEEKQSVQEELQDLKDDDYVVEETPAGNMVPPIYPTANTTTKQGQVPGTPITATTALPMENSLKTPPPSYSLHDSMNANTLVVCYDFIGRLHSEINTNDTVQDNIKNDCKHLMNGIDSHFRKNNIKQPQTPKEKKDFKASYVGEMEVIRVFDPIDLTQDENVSKEDDAQSTSATAEESKTTQKRLLRNRQSKGVSNKKSKKNV